ncbi:hypothetical protein ACOMHN_041453 [Nucella lapillus]
MRSISGTSGASSWELMEDCSPQSPDSLPPGRGNSAVGLSAPLGTARHCNGTRCLKYWTVSSVCPQTLMLERRSKKKGLPKKARLQKAFAKKVDFRDKPREELPYLKVPLHAVETWAPVASGFKEKVSKLKSKVVPGSILRFLASASSEASLVLFQVKETSFGGTANTIETDIREKKPSPEKKVRWNIMSDPSGKLAEPSNEPVPETREEDPSFSKNKKAHDRPLRQPKSSSSCYREQRRLSHKKLHRKHFRWMPPAHK